MPKLNLNKVEKEQQITPIVSAEEKLIKFTVEINEIKNSKNNETKGCFF